MSSATSVHPTLSKTLRRDESGNILTLSYQGEFSDLLAQALAYDLYAQTNNDDLPTGNSTTSGTGISYPYVAGVNLRRSPAGGGDLDVVIKQICLRGTWGLDFAEISKPIMSWIPAGGGEAPDLSKIKAWQFIGERDARNPDYAGFAVDGEALEGNTLKLAQMIFRGIQSYTVYLPVATWSCRVFDKPDVSIYPVGVLCDEPAAPHGIEDVGNKEMSETLAALTSPWTGEIYKWLRTASKVSQNQDGSFTWIMQWTACEDADSDLYPAA